MTKMHSSFIKFNDIIRLSNSKENELRVSRDAIRNTTKKWLSDNGHGSASFRMQGSISMRTAVNPVDGGEYDIDDGIYLEEFEGKPSDEWPACATVHEWVRKAVEDQTIDEPIDKNTCVRVAYKHGYHVDIPIYILKDEKAYLAHKRDGWVNSDAKEFRDWLTERCRPNDGQLRRIIRYLKRWKDENGVDLKGIELTLLAADNFTEAPGRDDDALRYTVGNIIDSLETSFSCKKPVSPFEDLLEGSSDTKKTSVLSALGKLHRALEDAHDEDDRGRAADTLRGFLGDDFPHAGSPSNKAAMATTAAPAVLKRDGRSG